MKAPGSWDGVLILSLRKLCVLAPLRETYCFWIDWFTQRRKGPKKNRKVGCYRDLPAKSAAPTQHQPATPITTLPRA